MEQKLIPITEIIVLENNEFVLRKCYYDADVIWKFREITIPGYKKDFFATLITPRGDIEAEIVVEESIEQIRELMKDSAVMEKKHKYEGSNERNNGDWRNS